MVRCCQGQIWSTIRAMSEPVYHQFKLRMPVDLFRRLEAAAEHANRSVSAEILHRVDRSFDTAPRDDSPGVAELTSSWAATQQHLEHLAREVAAMERLEARTAIDDYNHNGQPPGWTPPPPLPDWASLKEALAFYRSWRDQTAESHSKLTNRLFLAMGVVLPEAPRKRSARKGKE